MDSTLKEGKNMKKVAHILYLVGAIFGLVGGAVLITLGLVFTTLGAVNIFNYDEALEPAKADAANLVFLIVGVVFLVWSILYFIAGAIGFQARTALRNGVKSKGIYISAIVFGAITVEPFMIVPGIFSCRVANYPEPEKEEVQAEVVDK